MLESVGSIETESDPSSEISRLEARIEMLADGIERCRKIMFASKIAIALGAVVLALLLIGAIRPDPVALLVGAIACIGGIVMLGSNRSTAQQMATDMTRAEAQRAKLIDGLTLRRADVLN